MKKYPLSTVAVVLLALFLVLYLCWNRAQPKHYNVVLISIDSLRTDHMGTYGYNKNTTPNIDAFGKDSIVFENFFSTSFITPISEASVQTGKYPFDNGIVNFESSYKPGTRTLAEVLKGRGWKTAAFGYSPEFFRINAIRDSFSHGFDTYRVSDGNPASAWFGRNSHYLSEAIDWAQSNSDNGSPFFLWFNVGSVHWPYGQDEPAHFSDPSYSGLMKPEKYGNGPQLDEMFNKLYGLYFRGKIYDENGQVIKSDASNDLAYVLGRYDDGIVMTDRELKPLFDFLNRPDIKENTIVIIQSEHGEDFGEHGYIAHYDVLDTQVHTPLIMRLPGVAPKRVRDLISGIDIFPTVLDFMNIAPGRIDGRSFSTFLTSSTTAPRDAVYLSRTPLWERIISRTAPWLDEFVVQDDSRHFHDFAIRTSEWKLIHRISGSALDRYSWYGHLTGIPVVTTEYELYHVSVDPLEQHNVYSSEEGVALPLMQKLGVWERFMNVVPLQNSSSTQIQPYF